MRPNVYEREVRGVALAAEHQSVQAKIDQGHEFAALMKPGGSLLIGGEWREVSAVTAVPDTKRVVIVCADGTQWIARQSASRPYRSPESEAVES
jgi:hypothetical protein